MLARVIRCFFIILISIAILLTTLVGKLAAQSFFKHPGILVSIEQLDYVKQRITAGEEPWSSVFDVVKQDSLAKLDYQPDPWFAVNCGSYSRPNWGCSDEIKDARAAYTQALLWYYSGDKVYAENAINIINAWSYNFTGGHSGANEVLQASWAGALWPRAAEIIRHTYDGWKNKDVQQFENMLRMQYLPSVTKSIVCYHGNWLAASIEARANIAIFLEDIKLYRKAIRMWRESVPAYIYLESDGILPRQLPGCWRNKQKLIAYWQGQRTFVNGLTQETCRDLEHMAYALAGFINVAETAYIQGLDLYGEQEERFTSVMEFHTKYKNKGSIPHYICNREFKLDMKGTLEIAYNHYAVRRSNRKDLPHTWQWLSERWPAKGHFHYVWEILTHGNIGNAGID
ncbi:alginate lyase family protein [Candidatus Fukatsuia symbiotica]|uniref:Alginate lyase domain-containing protein n=1 Tax=Candidatus Fukatsuia symbiotica TaxID=1878942 RepID=A0A2U8I8Q0_9GAMM|nr:alginate lyase family protein [Candidatus Fukatsuia symbiotica]AWK14435.1 hypothetical protein CCS41_08020 [Candidatus Fukatsuia symbiotica]MEA9444714.1 alginate lyase family protein [Candidatus Fukatsuia symbiotica]